MMFGLQESATLNPHQPAMPMLLRRCQQARRLQQGLDPSVFNLASLLLLLMSLSQIRQQLLMEALF